MTGKSAQNESIVEILEYYEVPRPVERSRRMTEYLSLLEKNREWAKLTSSNFKDHRDAALTESVAVAGAIGFDEEARVADLGAGGGLLGLVVAICCEDCQVVMVDSSRRKSAFLAEAIGSMRLRNASVINARAQSLIGAENFDVVISRAAGKLAEIAPVALGLLHAGDRYIALKAVDVAEEIERGLPAIESAPGRLVSCDPVAYPHFIGAEARASLVVIEKL